MEPHIPDILSSRNYEAIVNWLADPDAEAPGFADSFMTSLDALYMSRTSKPVNRRRGCSRLTLEYLISENAAPAPERPSPTPNPVLEELTALSESLPERPAEPAPKIEDGILPLTDENSFREAGMDSITVAGAIAWHWSQLDTELRKEQRASMRFIQLTLFTIYGTLLAERRTRLTAEHPQMWKYGPVFPRVYRRGTVPADGRAAASIRETDPALDEYIGRIVRINAEKGNSLLSETLTSKSSPWGRCLKRNPDKWSTPLDDRETAAWFRKTIDRKRP